VKWKELRYEEGPWNTFYGPYKENEIKRHRKAIQDRKMVIIQFDESKPSNKPGEVKAAKRAGYWGVAIVNNIVVDGSILEFNIVKRVKA
jgi:hypothetical protein